MTSAISVIIPCYHEADAISRTLNRVLESYRLNTAPDIHVIDAGQENDGTEKIVASIADKYQHEISYYHLDKPSRGSQLICGADSATTSFLLFLHADTLLPIGWDAAIVRFFEDNKEVRPLLGCFQLALPPPLTLSLQIMVWTANLRASLLQLPYGDQAYFVRRQEYTAIGGFANIPLMEDVDLLRRYKYASARAARREKGKRRITSIIPIFNSFSLSNRPRCVQMISMSVVTSPRRWNRKGVWWNTLCNQFYMLAWMSGISPATIYGWYYGKKAV